MSAHDELTATLCLAIQRLTQIKKARVLLNTALALIEDGQYGEEVESYFDVCLKTPGLPKEDMKNILLARQRNARKIGGGQLQCNPSTRQAHFSVEPASQRVPPEVWEQIAAQTPRYHLRKWLSTSPLHRGIASRQLFHTVDIYFLEFQNLDQGLSLLERAINDPIFAGWVKSLRLHWDYEEGDATDLLCRILKISLPAFKALQDFELIGKGILVEIVEVLLNTHKGLQGLAFREGDLDAVASSTFQNLRKFAFCTDEPDEETDLEDIRNVLDRNKSTLKHLILGGSYIDEDCPWDSVFESASIENLTHINFSSSEISGCVLDRIAQASELQSLTLHGSFAEPEFASQLLATTRLPHLESFRFVMEDQDDELYENVTWNFLRKRDKLRRLDLGSCPWETIQDDGLLVTLSNLRVLAVCIDELEQIESLVGSIPRQMVAIRLSVDVSDSDRPIDEYAHHFTRFNTLSYLHFQISPQPVKPKHMSEKDFQMQTNKTLRSIASAIPSLDFLACYGQLYIVVRSRSDTGPIVVLETLPTSCRLEYGNGLDIVSEDMTWLQPKGKDEF